MLVFSLMIVSVTQVVGLLMRTNQYRALMMSNPSMNRSRRASQILIGFFSGTYVMRSDDLGKSWMGTGETR